MISRVSSDKIFDVLFSKIVLISLQPGVFEPEVCLNVILPDSMIIVSHLIELVLSVQSLGEVLGYIDKLAVYFKRFIKASLFEV